MSKISYPDVRHFEACHMTMPSCGTIVDHNTGKSYKLKINVTEVPEDVLCGFYLSGEEGSVCDNISMLIFTAAYPAERFGVIGAIEQAFFDVLNATLEEILPQGLAKFQAVERAILSEGACA